MKPWFWGFVNRRLGRYLPPDRAASVAGDLLEDFDRRCRRQGRVRSEWWLLVEARSTARMYHAAARSSVPSRPGILTTLANGLADLRLSVRTLSRQPLLVLAAVIPVSLAIAANTALFSLTDGLLFRELRLVRDAGSVVAIGFDPGAYLHMEEVTAARSQLATAPWLTDRIWTRSHVVLDENVQWRGTELVERAVSQNFFQVLGVPTTIGRGFLSSDLDAGGPPPVVLGYELWRAQFAADPAILDSPIDLADVQVRVVGVAARTFDFPGQTNVWSLYDAHDVDSLPAYARVSDRMSVDAVRAQAPYPLRIRPLAEATRPNGALAVGFLFGAAALLLLVSWLQVGALLFSRMAGRSPEIGVRLALGAGRGRLLSAFALEGAVIASLALGLGWLAAPSLVAAVVAILPPQLTQGQQVAPDLRTLVFASTAAGTGVLLLAVLPMELLRRANPLQLLRGVSTTGGGRSIHTVRTSILLAQVTVTVVLLYVSGLVAHSFVRIATFDLGFDPGGVLVWRVPRVVSEGGPLPRDPAARAAFMAERKAEQARQFALVSTANESLRASAEIASAAASRYYPVIRTQSKSPMTLPDLPSTSAIDVRTNNVTPEFFDTLKLRLVEGRTFEQEARGGSYDAVVVNETLAAQLRPQGPVIGLRIKVAGITAVSGAPIVGVVADYVDQTPDQPPDPQVFLPTPPERGVSLWMGLVRVAANEDAARARIREVVEQTWGTGTGTTFTTMADEISRATAPWRGRTIVVSSLAALCLPLAIVGLVGALSYETRSRAREIAVRLALGAHPGHIRQRIVGRALASVAAGLVAGLGGGWFVGRLMGNYLFNVAAADPWAMSAVGGVLLLAAWLSALGPAWRASRTDPAGVLREG